MAKYALIDPTDHAAIPGPHDVIDGRYVDTQYLTILEDEWPAARARWEAERGPLDDGSEEHR